MSRKTREQRARGAPPKLELMGELHRYSPWYVPRELVKRFKKAVKEMMGTMTMSDYLRVRVAEDARTRLKGEEHPPGECNFEVIEWDKISWIKNPDDTLRQMTLVYYPRKHWEIFAHNCAVRCEAPKHRICKFIIELVDEHIRWRKEQWKKAQKKKKRRKK